MQCASIDGGVCASALGPLTSSADMGFFVLRAFPQEYTPSKFMLGVTHPDPVVESSSLAAAEPPDITYSLRIQVGMQLEFLLAFMETTSL